MAVPVTAASRAGAAANQSLPLREASTQPKPIPRNAERIRKLLKYATTCTFALMKRTRAISKKSVAKLTPASRILSERMRPAV